jgi:hypothetical protein
MLMAGLRAKRMGFSSVELVVLFAILILIAWEAGAPEPEPPEENSSSSNDKSLSDFLLLTRSSTTTGYAPYAVVSTSE